MSLFPESPRLVEIARLCYEANRAIYEAAGDRSQPPWFQAEQRQRDLAISGVAWACDNPTATVHDALPFYHLYPPLERVKDHVFQAIVRTMLQRPD